MAKQIEQLTQLNGDKYSYEALSIADNDTLEKIFQRGIKPDMKSMSGWEFKGYNTFDMTQALGFRKFKKGFYRENAYGDNYDAINGYNVKIAQNSIGLEDPWVDVMKGDQSIKFGWFNVYPVNLNENDNKYPNSILLNYGASDKNFALDPSTALRDYLVQVYPDNPDLLLGKAYIALGPMRVPVSFFILQRENQSVLTP